MPSASSAATTMRLQSKSKEDEDAACAAPPWARMTWIVIIAVDKNCEISALNFLLSCVSKCGGEGHLLQCEGWGGKSWMEVTAANASTTDWSSSTTAAEFLLRKDGSDGFLDEIETIHITQQEHGTSPLRILRETAIWGGRARWEVRIFESARATGIN